MAGLLAAVDARAATSALAPPGGGLGALAVKVDLAGARVLYRTCAAASCGAEGGDAVSIALDRSLLPDASSVVAEVLPVGLGKSVVHVRLPARGRPDLAWEAVIAPGAPPIFADATGFVRGQEGERWGALVQIVRDDDVAHVLVGQVREDMRICGQRMTILSPRGLDPATMLLRGATVQRLPDEQRQAAKRVVASARGGPADPPLAPLLVPEGASSAIGPFGALADGNPATFWSEARPGAGQGEFVMMRAPHEVPIARFAVVPAPAPKPNQFAKPGAADGAAPRRFFLVTDADTLAVTLPEDAWMHPGAAYEVPLSDPLRTSCVALVLDEAYARGLAHPEVTVSELYAYSEFDRPGAGLDVLAKTLMGGGARAEAAAGVLARAGAPGFDAMAGAYPSLDAVGRLRAMDVAASAPCETSAALLLRGAVDQDREVRRKAEEKLYEPRCARAAVPALVRALDDQAVRAAAARLLASAAPGKAIEPLAKVMGAGDAAARAAVRDAFARAAKDAPPETLRALLAASRPADERLELVRAMLDRLAELRPVADTAVEALLGGSPPMRTRYLLAEPIAALARAGDAAEAERLAALIAHDPELSVRARAAELAAAVPAAHPALVAAVGDAEPRVREWALRALASARVPAVAAAASDALARDPWTFVRVAAANALAALPPSAPVDQALTQGLEDKSPRVRAAVAFALGARMTRKAGGVIRARLENDREDPEVRTAAAHALGSLCDEHALDTLTKLARAGADPLADDATSQLALAAMDALGELHPADLASRLAPLRAQTARADIRGAAARALSARLICK